MTEQAKREIVGAHSVRLSLFELGYKMQEVRLREKYKLEKFKPYCEYCDDVHIFNALIIKDVEIKVDDPESEQQAKIDESKDIEPSKRTKKVQKIIKEIRCVNKKVRCDCASVRKNDFQMQFEFVGNYFSWDRYTFKCHLCRKQLQISGIDGIRIVNEYLVCKSCYSRNKVFVLDKIMLERASEISESFHNEVKRNLDAIFTKVDRELNPQNYISEDELKKRMREQLSKRAEIS